MGIIACVLVASALHLRSVHTQIVVIFPQNNNLSTQFRRYYFLPLSVQCRSVASGQNSLKEEMG
jgi:hypothetical protein